MTRRYYVNNAPQLTLNVGVGVSDTVLVVAGSFAGWPISTPYFAVLEYGTPNMEIVYVTAVAGTTATVQRGADGTQAVSHLAGATLNHGVVAADVSEANAHINSASGVHGVTGNLVGDADSQTLSNKKIANSQISGALTSFTPQSYIDTVVKPYLFANEAARDAALTTPLAGMMVWLSSPTTAGSAAGLYVYNGTAWRPGAGGSATTRHPHTYSVLGSIGVPSGDTNYLPPFFVPVPAGQTVRAVSVTHKIHTGTSVTASITRNGTSILTLTSTTTKTTTTFPAGTTFADTDEIALVVTGVSGTPANYSCTLFFDYTAVGA